MKKLLLLIFLVGSLTAFSQGTVTGTLIDADSGLPLASANVLETGTSNGAVADFDGNFSLIVSSNKGSITITYVGYSNKAVSYVVTSGAAALGKVALSEDANALGEVVVIGRGVIDLAG